MQYNTIKWFSMKDNAIHQWSEHPVFFGGCTSCLSSMVAVHAQGERKRKREQNSGRFMVKCSFAHNGSTCKNRLYYIPVDTLYVKKLEDKCQHCSHTLQSPFYKAALVGPNNQSSEVCLQCGDLPTESLKRQKSIKRQKRIEKKMRRKNEAEEDEAEEDKEEDEDKEGGRMRQKRTESIKKQMRIKRKR